MRLIDKINEMEQSGFNISELCKFGLIPATIILYRDIFLYVDARVQSGKKITQAVSDAETDLKVKHATVYKALKIMKSYSAK